MEKSTANPIAITIHPMETESKSLPQSDKPPQTPIEIDSKLQVMKNTDCWKLEKFKVINCQCNFYQT